MTPWNSYGRYRRDERRTFVSVAVTIGMLTLVLIVWTMFTVPLALTYLESL